MRNGIDVTHPRCLLLPRIGMNDQFAIASVGHLIKHKGRLIQQLANYRMNMHNYANLYIARLI